MLMKAGSSSLFGSTVLRHGGAGKEKRQRPATGTNFFMNPFAS